MFASRSLPSFIAMQQKQQARLDALEEKEEQKADELDTDEIRRAAGAKTWETGLSCAFIYFESMA